MSDWDGARARDGTDERLPGFDWGEPIDFNPPLSWGCHDCGMDTFDEFYIVESNVWPLDPDGGLLCLGCIEARIGRRLVPDDFTDCDFNVNPRYRRSARLQARLDGADPSPAARGPRVAMSDRGA